MNASKHYVLEKLYVAAGALARSGSIQDRLLNAFVSALVRIGHQDFKDKETGKRLEEMMKQVTRVEPTGDEGRLAATIRTLSDEECEEIAGNIISIFYRVAAGLAEF